MSIYIGIEIHCSACASIYLTKKAVKHNFLKCQSNDVILRQLESASHWKGLL